MTTASTRWLNPPVDSAVPQGVNGQVRQPSRRRARTVAAAALLVALAGVALVGGAVAGCAHSVDEQYEVDADDSTSPAPPPATVSVQTVPRVGPVLVSSAGTVLYVTDRERSGTVACTGGCAAVWLPLIAPAGGPIAGPGLTGTLGTVTRPDGSRQVTYDRRPLYRYTLDRVAGDARGDGVRDSFAGTSFTWHVATPSGG
jgi:predicted lipoprotein with Yx(FWY)xxD motif